MLAEEFRMITDLQEARDAQLNKNRETIQNMNERHSKEIEIANKNTRKGKNPVSQMETEWKLRKLGQM